MSLHAATWVTAAATVILAVFAGRYARSARLSGQPRVQVSTSNSLIVKAADISSSSRISPSNTSGSSSGNNLASIRAVLSSWAWPWAGSCGYLITGRRAFASAATAWRTLLACARVSPNLVMSWLFE